MRYEIRAETARARWAQFIPKAGVEPPGQARGHQSSHAKDARGRSVRPYGVGLWPAAFVESRIDLQPVAGEAGNFGLDDELAGHIIRRRDLVVSAEDAEGPEPAPAPPREPYPWEQRTPELAAREAYQAEISAALQQYRADVAAAESARRAALERWLGEASDREITEGRPEGGNPADWPKPVPQFRPPSPPEDLPPGARSIGWTEPPADGPLHLAQYLTERTSAREALEAQQQRRARMRRLEVDRKRHIEVTEAAANRRAQAAQPVPSVEWAPAK